MATLNRRTWLRSSAAALALASCPRGSRAAPAAEPSPRFRIGACDWSLGRRQTPEAFGVAREIGLDGVEVSFGEPGADHDLRDPAVRERYQQTAAETGVQIASLAMGLLNNHPYATDPRTEAWVAQVIEVMPLVDVRVCLLAFFGAGDIQGDRDKQDEVIRRLQRVAPRAEALGVVLGIESWMNADEHLRILDTVDSPAVQVYYDVANMTTRGYDVPAEIRQLGAERICQFHMKENGYLLGQGEVDYPGVREAIDEIDYSGWLIIEGATVGGRSLVDCYRHNLAFLQELFDLTG